MTSEEVRANLILHGACEDAFRAWGDLTSDEIWAFPHRKAPSPVSDGTEIHGLFWWVAKNAGTPGWATHAEISEALRIALDLALPRLWNKAELLQLELKDNPDHISFFNRIAWVMRRENTNPAILDSWHADVLPIVKGLKHP